jgi:superfamily I DNA/RNA helicase
MATIIMSKLAGTLDASVKKKAYAFLEKLSEDDTAPGLHIEPITNSADSKVRTGRVDQFYRAVLFKVPSPGEATYVFHGIWPHDDAIAVAKKTRLAVNPVNGIAEITAAAPEMPGPTPFQTSAPAWQAAAGQPASPPVTAKPAPIPLLAGLGLDHRGLVDVLGIDESLAVRALAVPDENALLALAENAVEWQGLALIDLAAGRSVAEVQDRLSLGKQPTQTGESDSDRLVEGLRHPAAQMSFTWIESNDELRRVIEGGDFGAWRVFLHPEQRKYAERSYSGPFRLSGGAGTGKTVVLLHRTRMLARREPGSRVLLTTFTTNLADQLRSDLLRLDPVLPLASGLGEPGVFIHGIDALASAVLRRAGTDIAVDAEMVLGVGTQQVSGRTPNVAWQDALDAAGGVMPSSLRSAAFLAAEYAQVVLPNRITTREAYYKVRRPGRGVALDRAKRAGVWDVIEAYRAQARIAGTVDFPEAATITAAHLRRMGDTRGEHVADHVLVDEGQDLGPAHWQLLRALTGEHVNDLFIAEDSHQRIYGQRIALSQFGIRIVGRSRRLTLNYRTTAQNLAYAITVLEGGTYVDLEEKTETSSGYRSARSGPAPRLIACTTLSEELDQAAELVSDWVEAVEAPETVAVLVREQRQRDRLVTGLAERGVTIRAVDREHIKPGQPVTMTMHRAKGTEFSKVLLFGVSQGAIPRPLRDEQYAEDAWADALLRERSLLYVAATRARDELALSWSGEPSQLLFVPEVTTRPAPSRLPTVMATVLARVAASGQIRWRPRGPLRKMPDR